MAERPFASKVKIFEKTLYKIKKICLKIKKFYSF